MGTSSVTLFAEDTACDVRDEFTLLLGRTRDPERATQMVIESWKAQLADADDGPVIWLALAETQWKLGCLSASVGKAALEVIDQERDLHRWDGSGRKKRRAVLAALKEKLLSEQPKFRIPRLKKLAPVASVKVLSADRRAMATAYALVSSSVPGSPRTQVLVEMEVSGEVGGGGVFLATCEYTEIRLEWPDPETLRISYPATAQVVSKSSSTFYFGRTIQIVYEARDA